MFKREMTKFLSSQQQKYLCKSVNFFRNAKIPHRLDNNSKMFANVLSVTIGVYANTGVLYRVTDEKPLMLYLADFLSDLNK
jgi:hypothetical protein